MHGVLPLFPISHHDVVLTRIDKFIIPYCQTLARTVHKAVGHPKPQTKGFSTAKLRRILRNTLHRRIL